MKLKMKLITLHSLLLSSFFIFTTEDALAGHKGHKHDHHHDNHHHHRKHKHSSSEKEKEKEKTKRTEIRAKTKVDLEKIKQNTKIQMIEMLMQDRNEQRKSHFLNMIVEKGQENPKVMIALLNIYGNTNTQLRALNN